MTDFEVAHFLIDVCNFAWPGEELTKQYEEPRTFQEAWNHPDPIQRLKWCEGIWKEFHDTNNLRVWKRIRKKDITFEHWCVKSKWVFKINKMFFC